MPSSTSCGGGHKKKISNVPKVSKGQASLQTKSKTSAKFKKRSVHNCRSCIHKVHTLRGGNYGVTELRKAECYKSPHFSWKKRSTISRVKDEYMYLVIILGYFLSHLRLHGRFRYACFHLICSFIHPCTYGYPSVHPSDNPK